MRMDEDAFRERYVGRAGAGTDDAYEIVPITAELLSRLDRCEEFLHDQGFRQVRVRHHDLIARIEIERGPLEDVDAVFSAAAPVIAAAVYGGQPLTALERAGMLAVDGDRALAERFVTLFPLPPKVETAG